LTSNVLNKIDVVIMIYIG